MDKIDHIAIQTEDINSSVNGTQIRLVVMCLPG